MSAEIYSASVGLFLAMLMLAGAFFVIGAGAIPRAMRDRQKCRDDRAFNQVMLRAYGVSLLRRPVPAPRLEA